MKLSIIVIGSDKPEPLSNVELTTPLHIGWPVTPVGKENKMRREGSHHPIRITLQETLGPDCSLLKLKDRAAGFGLKLTYSVDDAKDGVLAKLDILDIDLQDLLPDAITIDSVVELSLITNTEPRIIPNPGSAAL